MLNLLLVSRRIQNTYRYHEAHVVRENLHFLIKGAEIEVGFSVDDQVLDK